MISVEKKLLMKNCYPEKFVNNIFGRVLSNIRKTSEPDLNGTFKVEKVLSIPYVPYLSGDLSGLLNDDGYQVPHKRYNTLQCLLSKLKAESLKLDAAGVVYHIPCND
ncbi:unnamed protein product [Bemisia tabaci]|uniref:Uncharacterized protein n=1 Tax=Bemisia tabaci TaxID=7038 RepID=A0A9P0AJ26_BEMTA|nr:unnamed protein product [Bemisia tabaci]